MSSTAIILLTTWHTLTFCYLKTSTFYSLLPRPLMQGTRCPPTQPPSLCAPPPPPICPSLSLTGWVAGKWQGWQTRPVPGLVSCRQGAEPPGGVSHHGASSRSNEGDCRLGIPSPVSGIGRQISSASRAQHKWYVDKCRYFTFNWH